jgi:hypothetical protein
VGTVLFTLNVTFTVPLGDVTSVAEAEYTAEMRRRNIKKNIFRIVVGEFMSIYRSYNHISWGYKTNV